jgi:hypothetical protein
MRHFDRKKMLVTSYYSLIEEKEKTVKEIFRFLGVEDVKFSDQSTSKANIGKYSKTRLWVARLVNRMRYDYFHEGQRLRPKENIGAFGRIAIRALQALNQRVLGVLETGRPSLQPRVHDRLVEYYREDAEHLRSTFDLDINHWSVFSSYE